MSGFPSPSSSPGIPTPASSGVPNRSWADRWLALQLPYLGDPSSSSLGSTTLGVPPSSLAPESHPQPPHPTAAPSSTGGSGTHYLPLQSPTQVPAPSPLHGIPPPTVSVCAKLHRIPLAPLGYHWLKRPAAQESQPPAPLPPAASTFVLQPAAAAAAAAETPSSWGGFVSQPTAPPAAAALWCPVDLAWCAAGDGAVCVCPLLPTGGDATGCRWTRRSGGPPPHEWLLRPPGYAPFPAAYPPADCMLCRDVGRFGLVRNGCLLHDFPV